MEAEPTPAGTRSSRIASAARAVYLVGLAAVIVWLVIARGGEVAELLEDARPALLVAALAATFVLIVLLARFWTISLRMLGHEASLKEVVLATARALPARYIPGGISFPVARIALMRAGGLGLAPLGVAAVLEMVIRPAVALILGSILLAFTGDLASGVAWAGAAVAVAVVAISPAIGGRALAWLAARRGITLKFTWNGYARLAAAETLYWVWASATFVLYLRSFPAADGFGTLRAAGAFMVAWAVGFLTVFAPQGIGVAEISLIALLAAGDDNGSIAALAVLFGGYRLVQLARDMAAAAAAEVIARRQTRPGSRPSG